MGYDPRTGRGGIRPGRVTALFSKICSDVSPCYNLVLTTNSVSKGRKEGKASFDSAKVWIISLSGEGFFITLEFRQISFEVRTFIN